MAKWEKEDPNLGSRAPPVDFIVTEMTASTVATRQVKRPPRCKLRLCRTGWWISTPPSQQTSPEEQPNLFISSNVHLSLFTNDFYSFTVKFFSSTQERDLFLKTLQSWSEIRGRYPLSDGAETLRIGNKMVTFLFLKPLVFGSLTSGKKKNQGSLKAVYCA